MLSLHKSIPNIKYCTVRKHKLYINIDVNLLSIGPLGTNSSVIILKIQKLSLKEMHLEMVSAK